MPKPIAHIDGQGDMNERENGEGVTERAMDDVPQAKYLSRAGEEQDALGEFGLFLRDGDGVFELGVPGA